MEGNDLVQAVKEIHEMQESNEILLECLQVKLVLHISQEDWNQIEIITRELHHLRVYQVTGSKCG